MDAVALSWRHVLKDQNNEIFLTDLSSLTKVSSSGIPEAVLDKVVQHDGRKLFIVQESQLDKEDENAQKNPRGVDPGNTIVPCIAD